MKQLHNIICVAWYKSTWNLVRWTRCVLCVFAFVAALVAGVWLFGYDAIVPSYDRLTLSKSRK